MIHIMHKAMIQFCILLVLFHSMESKLLLHLTKSSPHIIPYPAEVSCDVATNYPEWAQISYYYPRSDVFDRVCLLCQLIERKTECYSNFWGMTSEKTISEDIKVATKSHLNKVLDYLHKKAIEDLTYAQIDNAFEIPLEPYIGCSWLRTIVESGRIIRCKIASCKWGLDGLLSPLISHSIKYNDSYGLLDDSFHTILYSPAPSGLNSNNCPFSLKGLDYCSGGSSKLSAIETFVCTTSHAILQIDHASGVSVCEIDGSAIFMTRSGEYISRRVIPSSKDVVKTKVRFDEGTRLDIRRSISSLSELNFVNNIINTDNGSRFYFEKCLQYKSKWAQWAFGYPESCLAALSLVSNSVYAACTYSTEGILAYETTPIYALTSSLRYDHKADRTYIKLNGSYYYVIPFLGIVTNKLTNSSQHQYVMPQIFPLSNGNFWSLQERKEITSSHYINTLKILTRKPSFKGKNYFTGLLTVPFSHHLYPDYWENHTADYKQEILPLLVPTFGSIFNSVAWMIIILILGLAFVKILPLLCPRLSSSDRYKNLQY